jgi:hypothetical protein
MEKMVNFCSVELEFVFVLPLSFHHHPRRHEQIWPLTQTIIGYEWQMATEQK